MVLQLGREALRELDRSLSREWLETNGLGGFASSTVIGLNTRRYHGLLTAATRPPVGRVVLLSKLEETLIIDGSRHELSTNDYGGVIHPQGFLFQTQFRLDPFPVFTYELEGLRLEKSVLMVHGQNTTVVIYELCADNSAKLPDQLLLELHPLIAFRDYHSTMHENGALDDSVETQDAITSVKPYRDLPWLHLAHDVATVERTGYWYRNLEYAVESERGLDAVEDLFNPFTLTFDLNRFSRARIIASTERRDIRSADACRENERRRRQAAEFSATNPTVRTLSAAADQFIAARGSHQTIIAGYHWFGDWGRDTMIALPGLTLATNRPDIARSILAEFAQHVDHGMLPNRFPEAGETAEYNTVDATLWLFEAVRALLQYTNDYDFVQGRLYRVLQEIVSWHVKGTRYNIHVDVDGLLFSGAPGVQLTWMDARVGDKVITPRYGKPVEIQALWYNALRVMQELSERFAEPEKARQYSERAEQAHTSFNEQFWNDFTSCLNDVVNGNEIDSTIRPNQIIALSLTHSMVSQAKAEKILKVIERELLTSRGLRSLSPTDPKYRGVYEGDPSNRDAAYHQGTVWPWLIGPFIRARAKILGRNDSQDFGRSWFEAFEQHFAEAGLGQVSEIFDAEPPHRPRGCIAQAWSVAELLRAAVEDVFIPVSSTSTAKAS
jgi:predicted glycogen debranching enzyme